MQIVMIEEVMCVTVTVMRRLFDTVKNRRSDSNNINDAI